jgi:hypothetical protein
MTAANRYAKHGQDQIVEVVFHRNRVLKLGFHRNRVLDERS